jgi:20S proteasome subunit beta 2
MELPYAKSIPQGGFSFDNYLRNETIMDKVGMQPKMTSTGTTIVGCVFNGGVALAADTRATMGPIVGDKNCFKLHYLAPNIYTCGAGTAADCDHVTEMIKRDLALHRLHTGTESWVATAVTRFSQHLFKYMGHIGCGLIIGGIDVKGPQLCSVDPHGLTQYNPYLTTGSGSLAAMSIMETEYKDDMTREEATALVVKCIEAGIYHDLGSGSNVDVCIITKEHGAQVTRSVKHDNFKIYSKPGGYVFPVGTT